MNEPANESMSESAPSTTQPAPPVLLIGVRLSARGEAGELFADAKAVEAAGADSLWVDAIDGDPYVVLAALAAVTWRVRLVARGAPTDVAARETCESGARSARRGGGIGGALDGVRVSRESRGVG